MLGILRQRFPGMDRGTSLYLDTVRFTAALAVFVSHFVLLHFDGGLLWQLQGKKSSVQTTQAIGHFGYSKRSARVLTTKIGEIGGSSDMH